MKTNLFLVTSLLLLLSILSAQDNKSSDAPVIIYFTGDVTMANHFEKYVKSRFEYPFSKMSWFKQADISMINLENPLTKRGTPRPKLFNFRADPAYVKALKLGGIDIVTLANNHIYDYSEEGVHDTIEHLNNAGIRFVGAGRDSVEAYKPEIFSIRGLKIAFLAYYGSKKHSNSHPATIDSAGTAMRKLKFIKNDINKIKDSVDIISVNLHWGYEKENYPDSSQIRFAHRIIDYGADLIIGHHPHVLQGVERYKGKVIAYSLGNFIFGGNSRTTERSAVLKISIPTDTSQSYNTELVPIQIDHWQPYLLTNTYKDSVLHDLKNYSSIFEDSIF